MDTLAIYSLCVCVCVCHKHHVMSSIFKRKRKEDAVNRG